MTREDLEATLESDADEIISHADLQLRVATGRGQVEGIQEIFPLSESDLQMLQESGPSHTSPQIKHIRAYHHIAALRLASGDKAGEVARAIGLTPATMTRLIQDPQFAELVENYRGEVKEKLLDHVALAGMVGFEALSAIHERLADDELRNEIPVESLRKLFVDTLDRIGHAPVRRSEASVHHRHSIEDATLDRIKALHPKAALYGEDDPQGALEAGHEEASASAGAKESISAVMYTTRRQEPIDVTPKKGSGL